jgi:hypothetical protein
MTDEGVGPPFVTHLPACVQQVSIRRALGRAPVSKPTPLGFSGAAFRAAERSFRCRCYSRVTFCSHRAAVARRARPPGVASSSCPATCRRGCRMPSSPSCAAANTTALIVLPTRPPPASLIGFQPGERVRIRTGVFRGCFGLCENQPARPDPHSDDAVRRPTASRVRGWRHRQSLREEQRCCSN